MSFLGDIVNSIGSGKAPTPPKYSVRPLSANSVRVPGNEPKLGARPSVVPLPSPLNGIKRKADTEPSKEPDKYLKLNSASSVSAPVGRRPAAPPLNAPKLSHEKTASAGSRPRIDTLGKASTVSTSTPTTQTAPPSAKPPPVKGSFADIMARAKLAQESKGQNNKVGVIRHQASNREKVSKLAERKRQEDEKAKASKEKSHSRPGMTSKDKARSVSPTKRDASRAPKVARPPLHAPASSYKGTMGQAASKSRQSQSRKRSRYDEYLDTDEEEGSDMEGYGDEDQGDYESDVSSDMEVGAFELDEEESQALRAAKEDDARELALEQRLKREKEERRKRLMGLASKNKGR
ncbi:hypothetical protein PV10_07602 [Exophiala mesophila]|uniref:SPT2 chromatin protein n=1 Tax=Exophiala mesophila TaxID=212818 RepID=A0A0D1ZTZ7_EXOME|nr:uncharacterized protein PV10_07602 [Exophiala mesophila]KIV90283.1 hypothetical protein PV10_07602 [Exophiala mesophila]